MNQIIVLRSFRRTWHDLNDNLSKPAASGTSTSAPLRVWEGGGWGLGGVFPFYILLGCILIAKKLRLLVGDDAEKVVTAL